MSFSWSTSNPTASPTLPFGGPQNLASPLTQNAPPSQPFGSANQNLQTTSWFSTPSQPPWTGMQNQSSIQGNLLSSSKPPIFSSPAITTAQSSSFPQSSGMFSSSPNVFATSSPGTNVLQSTQQSIKNIKFSDLPEAMKTEILEIEKFIRSERQKCLKLETQDNLQQLKETESRIDKTFEHFQMAKNTWESLVVKVQACKNVIKNEMNSVESVSAIMESATREDMISFPRRNEEALKRVFDIFFSYLNEMERNMDDYEQQTQTAMSILQSVPKNVGWKGQAVEDVLKQEYEYFIFVASKLANLREKFRKLKEKFLKLLQLRHPDAVNPFEANVFPVKPSNWNEYYDTSLKNTSTTAQRSTNNSFTTPMSEWKLPMSSAKGFERGLGRMDENNRSSTPLTGYSHRRDIENSSFKTPLPQVTRFSVSSFLQ